MNETKWALRRIRKGGRVKIGGVWFKPDTQFFVYDGRLDGMVYLFCRYQNSAGYLPLLQMWGSEAMVKALRNGDDALFSQLFNNDPQIVNGGFAWLCWRPLQEAKL